MHFSKHTGPGSSRGEESSLISWEGRCLDEIFPFIVRFLLISHRVFVISGLLSGFCFFSFHLSGTVVILRNLS